MIVAPYPEKAVTRRLGGRRRLGGPGRENRPSTLHTPSHLHLLSLETSKSLLQLCLQFPRFQTLYFCSITEIRAKCKSKTRNKSQRPRPIPSPSQFVGGKEQCGPIPPAASTPGRLPLTKVQGHGVTDVTNGTGPN